MSEPLASTDAEPVEPGADPSRRDFLTVVAAGTAAVAAVPLLARRAAAEPATAPAVAAVPAATVPVRLNVNGVDHRLDLDPRATVLDTLRETLGLTGTKKGCDHGQCGACTVLLDGRRVDSCLVLAAAAEGSPITTIEGLAKGDELHPVQAAFLERDAFQCGYCTPGQICSAVGLLAEGRVNNEDQVREQMSGNLCRCGAYANIVAAVMDVLVANAAKG